MEITENITALEKEASRFAASARLGDLDTAIPPCPGWNLRDLVRHLGEIHLWAAAHVALRATKMWVDDLSDLHGYWPDLAVFWPDDADLIDWYLETNANLVRELRAAPSDLDAMTFLEAPSPLAMWARRQAHETAVHRFDSQAATGTQSGFDPRFAADGVDELVSAFAPRADQFPIDETRTMSVHARDTSDHWHITLTPHGITTTRDNDPGDVALVGHASDLYLALWNRGLSEAIEVAGDRDVLEAWGNGHRVRWS